MASSRSINAGNAAITVGIKNRIKRGLTGVERDLKAGGRRISSIGATLLTASGGLLAFPIKAAARMQDTMGKFDVVFGESSAAVKEWSNTTAAAMGVPEQQMLSMLSGMQDLLVPMGVLPGKAEGMSKTLSQLAVDLGSFNDGITSEQAFGDLQAALTGSGEVMKKYGVVLTETAVKQEMLNMGLDPKSTDNAAKAQARMNIIMRGTTAAQGDAIRTAGDFSSVMRRLWAIVQDTTAAIGGPLLQDFATFGQIIAVGANKIKSFVKENQDLVRVVGLVVVAAGGIGATLIAVGASMTIAGVAVGFIGTAIAGLLSPIGLTVIAIAGIGASVLKYTNVAGRAIEWFRGRFGPLVKTIQNTVAGITDAIAAGDMEKAWEITMVLMEVMWLDMTGELRDAWGAVVDYVLDSGASMAQAIGTLIQGIAKALDGMMSRYKAVYDAVAESIGNGIPGGGSAFERDFGGAGGSGGVLGDINESIEGIRKFGKEMAKSAEESKRVRAEERAESKKAREARISKLRESLEATGSTARERGKASGGAASDGDGKTTSGGKSGGSTGTFSAFGATVLGRQESMLNRIAKATEESAKALKGKDGVRKREIVPLAERRDRIKPIAERSRFSPRSERTSRREAAQKRGEERRRKLPRFSDESQKAFADAKAAALGDVIEIKPLEKPKLDAPSRIDQANNQSSTEKMEKLLSGIATTNATIAKNSGITQVARLG